MRMSASLIETIAENLDQRRLEFTKLRRVLLNYIGTPIEPAVVRMGIPMIYALWEGYIKEVCQLYLEYIEKNVPCIVDLQPAILGYMWTSELRPLTGGLNFARKTAVASLALGSASTPVAFPDTEKEINTKSNLNYRVLEDIANHLCLDIAALTTWKFHLNALVNLRNNIAHGARPTSLCYADFDEYSRNTIALMEAFEGVICDAVNNRAFCNA